MNIIAPFSRAIVLQNCLTMEKWLTALTFWKGWVMIFTQQCTSGLLGSEVATKK